MKLNRKINLSEFEFVSYHHCTFCNSSDITKQVTIHVNPEINYFSCNNCKVSYTDKQLTEIDTKKLYANYYDLHQLKTGIEPSVLGKHIYQFISSILPNSSVVKILDYGGGDGSVAKYIADELLRSKNCKSIIDVYDVYEVDNKIKDINYLKSEHEIKQNEYDIVIASAVLEHLNSPMNTLHILFEALKPGACFYGRTPFRLPLKKLREKFNFRETDMQFPWHLFDMGRAFWNHVPVLFQKQFGQKISVIKSQPSLTEIPFKTKKKRHIAAKILKFPGYIFKSWDFVGGWEVFIRKV